MRAFILLIANCLHQYDIGGITPGSLCPSAESVFDEGLMLPPLKIIESNYEVRRDIEAVYLRFEKTQFSSIRFSGANCRKYNGKR